MVAQVEANRTPLLLAMALGGLIALLVTLRPGLQVGLAALAVGVMGVALFNRRAALYLIVPAIALTPEIPVLGFPLRLEDLLMIPLGAGWLAHQCVFKDRQRTPLDRLLLAYLVVGLLATAWGGFIGTVHFSGVSKDNAAPFHLLKRLEFVLLFFIVCDTLTTSGDVQGMTYMLMASMIGLSAFGIASYLANQAIAVAPADPGHEPGFASMINVALALSLLPTARRPARLLLIAVILFSVGALPPTLGRNYIATTGIIMLYIGLFYQRWVLLFFPLVWLVGLFIYPSDIVYHVLTLKHVFSPDTAYERTAGATLISRTGPPTYFGLLSLGYSPLLGFGLASQALGAFDSEYVTQLYYTGLAGLAIFLMLGARLFRLTGKAMRTARDPFNAALARGFHLILIAYAAHSIFSPSISSSRVGAVFFLVSGLLVALHRSFTQPEGSPMNRTSGTLQEA